MFTRFGKCSTHVSVDWENWIDFQDQALTVLMKKRFNLEATEEEKKYYKIFEVASQSPFFPPLRSLYDI
jgi:hypothetical protein